MKPNDQAGMVTVSEFAKALNVHRQTVYDWVDRGLVDARRLGPKVIRIPRSELERALRDGIGPQWAKATPA